MGIAPEEKNFSKRHPVVFTILVIVIIVALGIGLKFLQQKYSPKPEQQTFKPPVLLNESFAEVDQYFNVKSQLKTAEQDKLFKEKYQFNVFRWTCRPISCEKIVTEPTLKLVCRPDGFGEDVRVAMKEDCAGVENQKEVTVVFQLMSKTLGEYYLGRSGKIVS